ncbi:putative gamma-crystallin M2-like [Scophthalmus maximus]|uniref:Putative gamma-crystallin M2-like n=1 Tax=Scophthalmus maximus TaxID=52904 RepID=A0A2U9CFJ6_SCOMX|nr:gamma-crystallin M2 [Scophthalmus maximus]AWP13642.1 putative gamma-crystallin M2-like [Scophthalmus maximus]
MGKIIFYEGKDFCGRHFECSDDCADLMFLLRSCNSVRVENGCFMIYEKPNYSGNQYYLRRGEYPDFRQWTGDSDSVCSCRLIHLEPGSFNMRLYERIEFGGQMMDLVEDCPSVIDRFHVNNIFSCNVTDGNWLFYEHPHYRGRMYLIRPGNYKRFSEWGGRSARVGSIRRIMDY